MTIPAAGFAWYLKVMMACGSWGCGTVSISPMPSYRDCLTALNNVRIEDKSGASSAYCIVMQVTALAPPTPPEWIIKP